LYQHGVGEDAEADDSDEDSESVMTSAPLQEELYIEDPKKALRGFFEREGTFSYFNALFTLVMKKISYSMHTFDSPLVAAIFLVFFFSVHCLIMVEQKLSLFVYANVKLVRIFCLLISKLYFE